MLTISELIQNIEEWAPLAYQENYDNSGLLIGEGYHQITNVLICLDVTEAVLDEAIEKKCNLIIAHHPIIFKGLKQISNQTFVGRIVQKAIQNHLNIYALHTNLDNVWNGVNQKIANLIGLKNIQILQPRIDTLLKLAVFCPQSHLEQVQTALFEAGAGHIGNYSHCSFNTSGIGTFKANDAAKPFVGKTGELHHEPETKIEVILPIHLKQKVLNALLAAHPYEEVAYDLYPVQNSNSKIGAGMIGDLLSHVDTETFFKQLSTLFKIPVIKHSKILKPQVKKIAICGGSGIFLLPKAIQQKADLFLTADVKYHDFFEANDKITIADIGHYESEQFTQNLIFDFLKEKKYNFAVYLTSIDTNPVKYYKS